jgi:voltage-gated potassium channel Kch
VTIAPRRLGLDAAIVPSLLLLVARDLALFDPTRVLAWRLLHDPRLAQLPGWLAALAPRLPGDVDRDPVALLMAGMATISATAYLSSCLLGARARVRCAILGVAGLVLVVLPTLAFIGLGAATERPYGQDGGVVQLPLAMDRIAAGKSPYGADYSDSILGRQARASEFWAAWGGNPILRHHAYLPGTHLLMSPAYLACRIAGVPFDPRIVTLVAWLLAALLAASVVDGPEARLSAAALVVVNPLVYWHQVFGANDILVVALALLSLRLARQERNGWACAVLGLACATKQLVWPFAPFLLAHISGARSLAGLLGPGSRARLLRSAAIVSGVAIVVTAPIAALDPNAFFGDVVGYNVGLPGPDNYPLGGTPGFGAANFAIYFGAVKSLKDHVSFGPAYLLLVPAGLLILRRQLAAGRIGGALVSGSGALLLALYFSRVVHPNYLILVAVLFPLGLLLGDRVPAHVCVSTLLLLALAVEISNGEGLRTSWEDAVASDLPRHLSGLASVVAPKAGASLTQDPLGLITSATAAGIGVTLLAAALVGLPNWIQRGLLAAAAIGCIVAPSLTLARIGRATGVARLQDPWSARAFAEGATLQGVAPPIAMRNAREAWAESFRRDPPRRLEDSPGSVPAPARGLFGAALLARGVEDPRPVALASLALAALLAAVSVARAAGPLMTGLVWLLPPLSMGTVFGAPEALALAAVVAARAFARSSWPVVGGIVGGLGAGLAPVTLPALPFLLVGRAGRLGFRAVVGGAAAMFGATVVTSGAWKDSLSVALSPGLGVSNVALYFGVASPALALGLLGAAGIAVAGGFAIAARTGLEPGRAAAASACASALGILLLPGMTAHSVAVPIVLLGFAASLEPQLTEAKAAAAE